MLSTFLVKRALKKSARRLWNPVTTPAVNVTNKVVRVREATGLTSTIQLLTSYIENSESRLKLARRRLDMDVWLGITVATVVLDISENDEFCRPIAGSQ